MLRSLTALLAMAPLLTGAAPATSTGDCGALAEATIPQTTITSAAEAKTGDHLYCEVHGVIAPQTHFTIKLPPTGWTGQYVQSGCSGLCGQVPELDVPLFGFFCEPATDGHLVIAADDSGHTGAVDDGSFGTDPRLRVVFGLTSEHSLAQVAGRVMRAYYGHGPSHRYFDGCSTGGRQALMLAQRYPDDFDGILAGAPVSNLGPLSGLFNPWLVLHNTDATGKQILGPEKLPALHAAVLAKCGDPILDPRLCDFQPSSLRCRGADTPSCLTKAQVDAVIAFYRGPTDSHGRSLYNGGEPYGSELGWLGEFVVASGSPLDGMQARLALSYLRYLAYPHNPPADYSLTDVRFTKAEFDRLDVVAGAIYNANDPDLSAFHAHGGKLIMYHGWADPSVPPFSTLDYYAALKDKTNTRLYLIPGAGHCLFGPRADEPTEAAIPELLTPLMDWVERGRRPGVIDVPTIKLDGTLLGSQQVRPYRKDPRPAPGSLNAHYDYVGSYS